MRIQPFLSNKARVCLSLNQFPRSLVSTTGGRFVFKSTSNPPTWRVRRRRRRGGGVISESSLLTFRKRRDVTVARHASGCVDERENAHRTTRDAIWETRVARARRREPSGRRQSTPGARARALDLARSRLAVARRLERTRWKGIRTLILHRARASETNGVRRRRERSSDRDRSRSRSHS